MMMRMISILLSVTENEKKPKVIPAVGIGIRMSRRSLDWRKSPVVS
jgi:hypothetical protein